MEFGPRALGNRSIIADPRSDKMQKILNLKVKFRESFRPFAPSILAEDVSNLGGKTAGEIGDVIAEIQEEFKNAFDPSQCYTGPEECKATQLKITRSNLYTLPYPDNHPTDSNGDPIPWKDGEANVVVGDDGEILGMDWISKGAVSYTHLTLPTKA